MPVDIPADPKLADERGGSGAVLVGYGTRPSAAGADRGHRQHRAGATGAPRVISPVVRQLARDGGLDVGGLAGVGSGWRRPAPRRRGGADRSCAAHDHVDFATARWRHRHDHGDGRGAHPAARGPPDRRRQAHPQPPGDPRRDDLGRRRRHRTARGARRAAGGTPGPRRSACWRCSPGSSSPDCAGIPSSTPASTRRRRGRDRPARRRQPGLRRPDRPRTGRPVVGTPTG